jgi:hypothetical protein
MNDMPVASADSLTVAEDASATVVNVLANDSDPDGDTLTVSAVTQPANGTVTFNATSVSFTPDANFNGSTSFTYTVSDGNGGNSTATVSVTVTAVNDLPVASADSLTVAEDSGASVLDVLANDSDPDGDTLTVSAVTQPANGTVTFNATSVSFTPAANFNGSTSFTYTASDGNGGTSTATVSVTVTAVNDLPVASADSLTVAEDAPGGVNVDVLANDLLPDGLASPSPVSVSTAPAHGTATVEPDGSVTYRPAPDWNGSDSFTYELRDADGDLASATVSVSVTPVNDAPSAVDDAASALSGASVSVPVLANDTDLDGDDLAISAVTQGAHGTVAISGPNVTYSPAPGWTGTDSFTYTADDGHGASAVATVTVAVSLDLAGTPVAADDVASGDEDSAVTVDVLANDSGLADGPLVLSISTPPTSGAATVNPDGTVTFTPAPDANGTFSFTYTVTDADGDSASASVTVTVAPINDPPVALPDVATLQPGASTVIDVLANDSDSDGDALTLTSVTQGTSGGTVTMEAGGVRYTPAPGFTGTDTFTYTVGDGSGGFTTVTVTVTVTDPDRNGDGLRDSYGAAGGGCSSSGRGGPALLLWTTLALLWALARRSPRRAPRA